MDSTHDDAVAAYLAGRDVPCPSCGYNLRDGAGPVCPECGGELRLSLARPWWRGGYILFLAVVLGWVLLAGGMNAYRQWRSIHYIALSTSIIQIQTQALTIIQQGGTVTFNSQGGASFVMNNGRLVPSGGAGSLNWSAVPLSSWASFAWWGGLAFLAAAGLAAAWWRRRSLAREAPPRRLVAFASLVFVCYASWHVLAFVGEVSGLF